MPAASSLDLTPIAKNALSTPHAAGPSSLACAASTPYIAGNIVDDQESDSDESNISGVAPLNQQATL